MTTLRPARDYDLEFIYQVLRLALGPYIEQTWGEWDEPEQRRRFEQVTRVEDHQIIELAGEAIGCLCALNRPDELRLVRLFLLPGSQRRGIGTNIITTLLNSAKQRGVPVRLRVLKVNPARRLYERLGFVVSGESETHFMMEAGACPRA